MGPLGAAEAPGAAFHSANGLAKAGGHNDFMAPRTRALKTVDGAPSSTADKSPGSHRELHSSGMLECGHHVSVPHCSEDRAAAIRAKGSPFCAGRRPRRRESAWNPKFEDTQRTFTYPAMKYLRTNEILATFGRPWPICEKVGCRWLTSALPPGTKLGTAVDGVRRVHAAQAAPPPRHFPRRAERLSSSRVTLG